MISCSNMDDGWLAVDCKKKIFLNTIYIFQCTPGYNCTLLKVVGKGPYPLDAGAFL